MFLKMPTKYLILMPFFSFYCSKSRFEGGGPAPPASVSPTGPIQPQSPLDSCLEGDKITPNFSPEIQSCLDDAKIWDFKTKSCLQVSPASFPCSFVDLHQQVEILKIDGSSILSAQNQGAYLVACGAKNQGKSLVAQWFYPGTNQTCDIEPSSRVVTACFKVYAAEEEIPPMETEEQKAEIVAKCLAD